MLDQSAAELRLTVDELEKRYDTIENEGKQVSTSLRHIHSHQTISTGSLCYRVHSVRPEVYGICACTFF